MEDCGRRPSSFPTSRLLLYTKTERGQRGGKSNLLKIYKSYFNVILIIYMNTGVQRKEFFNHAQLLTNDPTFRTEIQDYFYGENLKLEQGRVRWFDWREIQIRMEYKYCPNIILIDNIKRRKIGKF